MPRIEARQSSYYGSIDVLRGIGIILIVAWHYGADKAGSILWVSSVGVDLFFVISGFLTGSALIRARDSENYFAVFFLRRALRTIPLFLVIVATYVLVMHRPIWPYVTFTQNILWAATNTWGPSWVVVTWSLALQEHFYLMLAPIIRSVPRRALPMVTLSLAAVALPIRLALHHFWPDNPMLGVMLMPCRMDSLFLGVFLAAIHGKISAHGQWDLPPHIRWLCVGAVAASLALLSAFNWDEAGTSMIVGGYTVMAVIWTTTLFILISSPPSRRPHNMVESALSWVGTRSYGVFLLHCPALIICIRLFGDPWRGCAAGAALTLLATAVSWRWFESPLIRWGHKHLRYVRPTRSAAPVGGLIAPGE